MFFNKSHPRHVGISDNFPEKSLYSKTMLFLAMGITTQQLVKLTNDTLDNRSLWNLVSDIMAGVKAKRYNLELQYGAQDRDQIDKTGCSINGVGSRFKKLKTAMASQFGSKKKANAKIDKHTGMFGTDREL